MSTLSLPEARELLPAYALGALDDTERRQMDATIARYPELASELEEFRRVAEAMPPVAAAEPPTALRERFLTRVAQEAATANPIERSGHKGTVNNESTGRITRDAELRSGSSGGVRSTRNYFGTAALITALAASLFALVVSRNELAEARAELTTRQQSIAQLDSVLDEQQATLNTLLGAEQALLVVNMESTAAAGPGMQFFWNVKEGRGLLHAYRLPKAAPGRAYQLWLIKDGKPVPSRVFNSDDNGRSVLAGIELPTSLEGVSAVAVTEEPESGSALPTTQPFMAGNVRRSE